VVNASRTQLAALVERGEVAVSRIARMAELPRSDQHTLKDADEIVRVLGDGSPASPAMDFEVTGIILAVLSLGQLEHCLSFPRKRGPRAPLGPRLRGDDDSKVKRHRQPTHLFHLGPKLLDPVCRRESGGVATLGRPVDPAARIGKFSDELAKCLITWLGW
jgi:hypothetical protein